MKRPNAKKPNTTLKSSLTKITLATLGIMSALSAQAASKNIGDLEIYQAASGTQGSATIAMMLDTSGSMRFIDGISTNARSSNDIIPKSCNFYGITGYNSRRQPVYGTIIVDVKDYTVENDITDSEGNFKSSISYTIKGCANSSRGLYLDNSSGSYKIAGGYADRFSSLKVGLISLLADGTRLKETDKIGMGNFPNARFSRTGNMMVPAEPLTLEHRKNLMNYVKNLTAINATPSANAYAEAGAYMLGTKTLGNLQNSPTNVYLPTYLLKYNWNGGTWWYQTIEKYAGWDKSTAPGGGYLISGQANDWLMNAGQSSWNYYRNERGNWRYPHTNQINNSDCNEDNNYCGAGEIIRGLAPNLEEHVISVSSDYQASSRQGFIPGMPTDIAIGQKLENVYLPTDLTYANHAGFLLSHKTTKKPDQTTYKSPIEDQNTAQCGEDGYGIYFLTDGVPNNSDSEYTAKIMNYSLLGGNTATVGRLGGLSNQNTDADKIYDFVDRWGNVVDRRATDYSGWKEIGQYAKILRDKRNIKGKEIRTATVGFGADFAGFSTKNIEVTKANGETETKSIPDCNTAPNQDAKNLCLWGEYPGTTTGTKTTTGGWGNGGFTSTGDAAALAQSVADFIGDLTVDNTVPAMPAGSIAIPDDPYSIASQQAIAYLPMLQPDLTSAKSAWEGNLKKYEINDGTFYGKNRVRLYSEQTNATAGQVRGITLNPASVDFWSSTDGSSGNDQVTSGGVYSNLKVPTEQGSERAVFIEDTVDGKATLRKFGVNGAGELLLDDQKINDGNKFNDSVYTVSTVNHLLAFMGYNGMRDTDTFASAKVTPSGTSPKLGGVLHSTPSLVSYSAQLDTNGAVSSSGRDEYVLFGSMNGALHLVDAKNQGNGTGGQEMMAIIPKIMLQKQPQALSMSEHLDVGKPVFGIDAPWLVVANHVYDFESGRISVGAQPEIEVAGRDTPETAVNRLGGMHAFGGFRMGAKGLYSIDLTAGATATPKINFVITEANSEFSRIGHIWNKPTLARIKMDANDKYGTDVLVFGGGYDMCYEDEVFQVGENTGKDATCNQKSVADGNAVYIIKAKTGELIWSASSSHGATNGKFTKVDTMKNSIVGGIEVLDRDNDGFMDHLYFADLGGQMFRADFINAGNSSGEFKNHNVVRVLHEEGEGQYKRRFYEKPVVDFHADGKNGTFGLAMVVSGDRSSPLSTMRSSKEHADRLYGIFDYDLTKPSSQLYVDNADLYAQDISVRDDKLVELDGVDISKDEVRSKIVDEGKKGWYHPLHYFEGYKNALYTKGMGGSEIVRGQLTGTGERSYLYTTVYNPDMRYTATDNCSAQVKGGSERQFYCLPYGVCDDSLLAGYQRAGVGIQELAFGPSGSEGAARRTRVLISSMLVAEHTGDSYGYNSGGEGLFETTLNPSKEISQSQLSRERFNPGPGYGTQNSFSLTPQRWYDLSATN